MTFTENFPFPHFIYDIDNNNFYHVSGKWLTSHNNKWRQGGHMKLLDTVYNYKAPATFINQCYSKCNSSFCFAFLKVTPHDDIIMISKLC